MGTDNWPVTFTYISRRLVKEIVQQHQGSRPGRTRVSGLGVPPGFSLSRGENKVDWDNPFELAYRATEAVRDHTGSIDARTSAGGRIPTGTYIRATMHLQQMAINLPVWETNAAYPIAGYAGYEVLPGFGRVFVGMVGSASNIIGRFDGGPPMRYTGRTPSDAMGLYDIIQRNREWTDRGDCEPAVDNGELNRERAHLASEDERMRAAAALFTSCDFYATSDVVDVLLKVHHSADDFDLHLDGADGHRLSPFRRALFGAPVWISTLPPTADFTLLAAGRREYDAARVAGGRDPDAPWAVDITPMRLPEPEEWHLMLPGDTLLLPGDAPVRLEQAPSPREYGSWDRFETWAQAYASVLTCLSDSETLEQWPPVGEDWEDFRRWTLDQALRLGTDPVPFRSPARRFTWRGLRFETRWQHAGEVGWLILGNRPELFHRTQRQVDALMLTDGRVFRCDANGRYSDPADRPRAATAVGDTDHQDVAAAMLRTVCEWRRPLYLRDPAWVVEINEIGMLSRQSTTKGTHMGGGNLDETSTAT